MSFKKTYGLNIRQKEEPPKRKPIASVFGDDEDDEDMPATAINASSASVIRVQKAAEREHQKAEAEDPNIFDYDANYEEDQKAKNAKKAEASAADRDRKPKYADTIIKAHHRRQLEQNSREERQQIREREKEGDEFADKETFVTGAYRKQQEEVRKFREEEALEAQFNDATSVQHQKMWEMGMGRTLLNDLARDPTAIKQRKKEQKNVRKREDSDDEAEENGSKTAQNRPKSNQNEPKKSVYSSDSEPEEAKPPHKNFSGELKAGLNTVTKRPEVKAQTRAERVQRNFTPENSDDEGHQAPRSIGSHRESRKSSSPGRRSADHGRSGDRRRTEESPGRASSPERAPKISLKEKLKPKRIDKEARLNGLKAILQQRNTQEDIEEARQRYLERREQGLVVPPL